MLIGFDYQIFAEQQFGGISRYFCSLATSLSRHSNVSARILAPLHINAYLRTEPVSHAAVGYYVHRLPGTGRIIRTISSGLFRPICRLIRPNILHETYYAEKPTCGLRVPRTLTVYDMIHEKFPGSFPAEDTVAKRKAAAVKRADHVFCISESTRRDLLNLCNVPEDRVSVTYLGCDPLPEIGPDIRELVGNQPYLLYVGARGGYKNFLGMLQAYATSAWLRNNFRLVCFGGGPLSAEEHASRRKSEIPETGIVQLGGGDDRLAALYRNAAAFVYPSLYEGFGIPPLEAMSAGCPVICSKASSIPEVVGDAGEYFDPQDVEYMRTAIERVLQSPTRRQWLVERGFKRRQNFSWERCARETLDVYRRLT